MSVPVLSIVCIVIAGIIGFGIPVALLLRLRKKGADLPPFFVGCAVMLLFALVLESAVHRVVLGSAAGTAIRHSIWRYALYGGAMAAIFEETGRLLAFRTVLRRYAGRDIDALMYGAGHGGLESAALLGLTMVNNPIYSVLLNTGRASLLTAPLQGEALAQVNAAFLALAKTPSWQFLLGGVERIFAVALQMALSVLVWFAAKDRSARFLFPAALLIHFFVDAATMALSGLGLGVLALEGAVGAMTLLAVLYAAHVWKTRRA